jgi:hypothetical protein
MYTQRSLLIEDLSPKPQQLTSLTTTGLSLLRNLGRAANE